ncbi:hypothetical protein TREPR_2818 [Treponema primitia ZAS-2]|uniref:Uncharacterized protein n=1 Tax=Treponema primitia (strain ATCC BAA-887 / DSM 12427 / ZAS-2) TaxID=545694 RepID=F5YPX2_TREPZ|nr:hypothetical protein [Treponema primitia]AEF86606.1 hypothetical protein TREPR_2818 [Treponema primitia ZAS-2]
MNSVQNIPDGFLRRGIVLLMVIIAAVPSLMADPLNTMSLSGATGLYTVPTGRVAWTNDAKVGLDFGYHTIIAKKHNYFSNSALQNKDSDGYELNHIPKISASFFKWVDVFLASDFQPSYGLPGDDNDSNNDLITGLKVQLPTKGADIALGTNFQALNLRNSEFGYQALQLYAAFTHEATIVTLPAETSVTLGKTFGFNNDYDDSLQDFNFDFGMGLDLSLFPKAIPGFFHWIIDYSNFSYSANPWGANAWFRGTLNTGIRFNFASIAALNDYKFVFDIILTDAFDEYYRSFSFGLVFGVPFK